MLATKPKKESRTDDATVSRATALISIDGYRNAHVHGWGCCRAVRDQRVTRRRGENTFCCEKEATLDITLLGVCDMSS